MSFFLGIVNRLEKQYPSSMGSLYGMTTAFLTASTGILFKYSMGYNFV